jgi:hypothetical protein
MYLAFGLEFEIVISLTSLPELDYIRLHPYVDIIMNLFNTSCRPTTN